MAATGENGAETVPRTTVPFLTERVPPVTEIDCVREIRGMGLMLGMNLDSPDRAKAVVAELLQRGILINRTQDAVLRFLPPYIIQRTHVDQVVRALDAALISIKSSKPRPKKLISAKPRRRSQSR